MHILVGEFEEKEQKPGKYIGDLEFSIAVQGAQGMTGEQGREKAMKRVHTFDREGEQ